MLHQAFTINYLKDNNPVTMQETLVFVYYRDSDSQYHYLLIFKNY